jgi:hypothetical protein
VSAFALALVPDLPKALKTRTPQQLVVRSKIDNLEHVMRKEIADGKIVQTIKDCAEDNTQADHYFGDKVYARGLWIPAGTVVVGKLHRFDRICIVASGKCTFVNEWEKKTVTAPYVGEFKAGSKTAVFAHTDSYWVACHGTELTDPDELVEKLVSPDHTDYQLYLEKLED